MTYPPFDILGFIDKRKYSPFTLFIDKILKLLLKKSMRKMIKYSKDRRLRILITNK